MALILILLTIFPSYSQISNSQFGGFPKMETRKTSQEYSAILLYEELTKTIKNLEKSGGDQLDQKKIDYLKGIISKFKEAKLDKRKYNFNKLDERLDKLIDSWENKKVINTFYTTVGFLTWTFPEKIKDPQGTNSMTSVESGYCLGGGADWQNAYWGYGVDLCMAFMKANAAVNYGNQTYSDNGASVYSVISKPSIFWRPGNQVKLILYAPLVYRNALISGSSDIEILEQNKFFVGLFLGADWEYSNYFLSTSIGKIFEFDSSSWIVSLGYKFQ